MAPFQTRSIALLLAGLTLTTVPAFARESERRSGGTSRQAAARVPPRERSAAGSPVQSTQPSTQSQRSAAPRVEARSSGDSQQRVESRQRVESSARADVRPRANDNRSYDSRRSTSRVYDDRHYDDRRYDNHHYDSHSYDSHYYDRHHYDNHTVIVRAYPYPRRTYVVPYGYRPYGYRPGWSVNLYFGRPYVAYGYPAGYGYYAVRPGVAYAAVRIVDAPRDAQVFVDGYYAGVVDDYDGVFQHLNLEPGTHAIEIEAAGYPPIAFDVNLAPGQTITYHANLS